MTEKEKTLREELEILEKECVELRKRIAAKRCELESEVMAQLGVVIGETLVMFKCKRYKVARTDGFVFGRGKPWLRGSLLKKNNTFSNFPVRLYDDWEVIK